MGGTLGLWTEVVRSQERDGCFMKKRWISFISLLIMVLLLTACSATKENSKADMSTDNLTFDTNMQSGFTSGNQAAVAPETTAELYGTSGSIISESKVGSNINSEEALTSTMPTGETVAQSQDKIIKTFFMEVETQEFDSLVTKINYDIKRLNGYIEKSNLRGKGYYNNDSVRSGSIIARIPSDQVEEFITTVSENENANVVSQEESSKNVSLEYIEAESHLETLKIEQERLFAILEKEESLDNIITLESRLSSIRYELQDYETKIRYYDNQVSYSTVTMNLQEVRKLTIVSEEKPSVASRIKNGFGDTIYNLSESGKNFFVWFVVNLPYLIIWGIILTIAALIVRKGWKRSTTRKEVNLPSRSAIDLLKDNKKSILKEDDDQADN
ncbi:MAG: putative secreted protein [Herbinix sp.]|jgi:hypothetical protein|nr:putative secreted protein [Herbinix sp.]